MWALPGGFVDANEGLKGAALRELREETKLEIEDGSDIKVVEIGSFGDPGRDPRFEFLFFLYII